jgi:hypothetical protein
MEESKQGHNMEKMLTFFANNKRKSFGIVRKNAMRKASGKLMAS